MRTNETISLLIKFVKRNSQVVGIQWDPRMRPRLLINPFSKDYVERRKTAHYFLLVASVDETKVIERAENARKLLVHLHKTLGNDLFEISEANQFREIIGKCIFFEELGPERKVIPDVLASVNKFVKNKAEGDLIRYSKRFSTPHDMVEQIAQHVSRMGGPFKEKSWMYLRWMVRPKPDLRIFDSFSPRDLFIPLTTDITNVAVSLGLMDKISSLWWKNSEEVEQTRDRVTRFARRFFPQDPTIVDYPFFLLGRWLRGKTLGAQTLRDSLRFFENLYKMTGYAHVVYQCMSRYPPSYWERIVARTLRKMKIHFRTEPLRFPLPNNMFYTPDFILNKKIQNRRIILEPHRRMGERDVLKYSLFRRFYKNDYFLILLMRNNDIPYYRARNLLPDEAYDDIWPIEYVHILLTKLKDDQYEPFSP